MTAARRRAAVLGILGLAAASGAAELPPVFRPIRSRSGYANGIYYQYNAHGYYILLPGRMSRFDLPDLAGRLAALGAERWAVRFQTHRDLARAFKGALDRDPVSIPVLLPEIRRRFAAARATEPSPETLRRLAQLEAEIAAHAASFVCLCRGRCPRGRPETDEFSMDLMEDGRCSLHNFGLTALAKDCSGRRRDDELPDSYDEYIPREAACRVAQGPRQPSWESYLDH